MECEVNTFLKAQEKDKNLKFLPFVKEGGGAFRQWKLPQKTKKSKKVREAQKRLAEITNK